MLAKHGMKRKLVLVGASLAALLLIILPWIVFKGVRYNLWAFAHEITNPFYRVAYDAGLVRPENGPASQRLVDLVQVYLLDQPEYRAHDITLDQFLRLNREGDTQRNVYTANPYNQDVTYIVDRYVGWDTHYKLLQQVAVEAYLANPRRYVTAVFASIQDVAFRREDVPAYIPSQFDLFVRRPDQMPPIYRESLSHPNDVPDPSTESLQARADIVLSILAPLENVDRHPELAEGISAVWQAVWPPLMVVYIFVLIGLAASRRVSLAYLMLANLGAVGLCVLSAFLGNLERYRTPVEAVFIITASIGVAAVMEAAISLFKQLRSPGQGS